MPDAVLLDGAMFLKASLHCLKTQRGGWGGGGRAFQSKNGGWNGRNPPSICTQNACIMSFDEFYNNYVLDVVLAHGAML